MENHEGYAYKEEYDSAALYRLSYLGLTYRPTVNVG